MIRRPPRSTLDRSSAASDVYKRQDNHSAAQAADIAVLTVPYAAHLATLGDVKDALQGKILLDVTVPLVPPKVSTVQLPAAGSACMLSLIHISEPTRPY